MTKRSPGRSTIVAAASGGFLAGAIVMAVVLLSFPYALRWPMLSRPSRTANRRRYEGRSAERRRQVWRRRGSLLCRVPLAPSPPACRSSDPGNHRGGSGVRVARSASSRSPCVAWQGESCVTPSTKRAVRPRITRRSTSWHHGTHRLWRSKTAPSPAVREQAGRHHGLPVRSLDQVPVLLRPSRALRRRAQRGQSRPAGTGAGLRRHVRKRAEDTPHLHFAIFRLTDKKQWWQGSPIDPYDVLK